MNNQDRALNRVTSSGSLPSESSHVVNRTNMKPRKDLKQRISITIPASLLERLRNAVYWGGHVTLARLITDALTDAVCELEQANGGSFPTRLAPLKRGRPLLYSALPSDKTPR
jgi:hypothetical protein